MRLLFSCSLLFTLPGTEASACRRVPIPQTPCEATKAAVAFRGLVEAIPITQAPARGCLELQPESQCGRSRQVEKADADLQYLRKLPHVRTVLAGTLRTRAGFVAGKRIVASNASTTVETTTNSEGLFQFLGLPEGRYTLKIANYPELQGMNAAVKDELCCTVNSVTP